MRLLIALLLLGSSTIAAAQQPARKTIAATRADSMKLDGKLDEAVWQAAPAMTDFAQRRPNEGSPATDTTEVRFAFDDGALWVGARMNAANASTIAAPVTRRDNVSQSEYLMVSLDTFLDRRTAYSFGVTAAGTRVDRFHPSDSESTTQTYDPVWEAAVSRDANGWTAEMRIPFSQLRFADKPVQTWGVNVLRFVPSKNETDYWIVVPRKEVGWASRFGDLTGVEVRPSRRVEVLPYVAGSTRFRGAVDESNPLEESHPRNENAGADIKAGIGPNLTLDATINPDFGQVEADPAVVNLSAFESIFPERRPFFIEGAQLFSGGGVPYFYSRRIGAAPSGAAIRSVENEGYLIDAPLSTGILGAAKLTGRFPTGTSVGALFAVTDRERARIFSDEGFGRTEVAPRSYFGVFRGQQQFGKNGSTIGATLTGVGRDFESSRMENLLNERAFSGGTDWNLRFKQGEYEFGGYAGFSHIEGSASAIARAQRSSARYYQRPDADHVDYDPTRTSLSGFAAGVRGERAAGKWLWLASIDANSPGFELNDAGRLARADNIFAFGNVRYRETEPHGLVRDYEIGFNTENSFNFGGTRTFAALRSDTFVTWKNFWGTEFTTWMDLPSLSDRATRGGPLMGTGRAWVTMMRVYNSRSARNLWSFRVYRGESEQGERTWDAGASLSVRVSPRWQLSVEPAIYQSTDPRQYVTTRSSGNAVFSFIDRDELSLRLRANYALTPDLTFELYAEPFAASGHYYNFGELTKPKSRRLGATTFNANNLDYNIRSFRSNAVLRWEWRPGSTAYVVWQQDRFGLRSPGTARFTDLSQTLGETGDHIIAVKISYWLPL